MEGRKADVTKSRTGYVFEHLFDQEVSGRRLAMDDIHDLFNLLEKEDLIFKIRSRTLTYLEEEDRYDINPELRIILQRMLGYTVWGQFY